MIVLLPYNEMERLAALREHAVLDTAPEEDFDEIACMAARICGTPMSAVTLVDAERQWFKASVGLDARETPRASSFCSQAILQNEILVVPDAHTDRRFAGNPSVTGAPNIRFYAGVPLLTPDGLGLGALCVIDRVPRHLSPEQAEALRALGRQAERLLALRRSTLAAAAPPPSANPSELKAVLAVWRDVERQWRESRRAALDAGVGPISSENGRALSPPRVRYADLERDALGLHSRVEALLSGSPMRVLYVDDDETDQHAVRRALRRSDLKADLREVSTYAEALAALQDGPFDCLLIDQSLPDGDGLSLMREAHALGHSMPMIMLTGTGDERLVADVLRAGAADYLRKDDLTPLLLSHSLRAAVRVHQAQQAGEARARREAEERAAILERHQEEMERQRSALQQGQSLYLSSLDAMREGYLIVEAGGTVLMCNQSAERILGVLNEDLVGQDLWSGGRRFIREDGTDLPAESRPDADALATGRPCADALVGLAPPGGDVTWLCVSASPLRLAPGDTPYAAVVTFRDMTAQRRAEEERRHVQEALRRSEARMAEAQSVAHVGNWEYDIATARITWSEELFRLFEMDPDEGEPSVEALLSRYHPEDVGRHVEVSNRAMQDGEPYEFDVRIVRRDGSSRWTHAVGRGERDERGRVVRLFGTLMDIHERKRLEAEQAERAERLRRSEAGLRAVLESAPVILYAADARGTVTLSEGTGLAALGLRPGEAVGHSVFEYGGEDAENEANVRRALAGEAVSYDARVDGLCLHSQLRPLRGEDGSPAGVIGVCLDVTERVASEEKFRVLFEHSSDAHLLIDEGGLIDCNAAAVALLRCADKEHLLSLHPAVLSPEFQPDGRRSLEKCVEMDALAFEKGVHRFEWTHHRMDGEEFPVEVTLTPVTLRERPALLAVWHDLTERKRAEEAQRTAERDYCSLFENAAEGIFRTTPEGAFVQANPALAHVYGYETPEALIRGLTDIGGQLYADAARRAEFERLMRDEGGVSDFEARVHRKDGEIIWISVNARPVCDAAGELRWYEGFVQDVSARKALEAEQARSLYEAEERASRDPLTGLLNHRVFHRRLAEDEARAQQEGTSLAVAMLDLNNFKFFNDCYGHATGDEVLRHVAERLQGACRLDDTLARFGGDEFALLLPNVGTASAAEIEARLRTDMKGITYRFGEQETPIPITISVGVALFPQDGLDRSEVVRLADARLLRSKTGGAAETEADQVRRHVGRSLEGFSMLDALVTAVDNKDRYTRRHSEDVMEYSLLIARHLGLDEAALGTIGVAALLHDVGKIGVPDAILRKPGKLTDEEFEAVKQHPAMGAVMVGAVPGLGDTLDAVRHHHERWDGGGYPFGLKGEDCPLIARLMAVADAFSAMTTDRPYRKGMPHEKALSILKAGAGTQWDPQCVKAFFGAMGQSEEFFTLYHRTRLTTCGLSALTNGSGAGGNNRPRRSRLHELIGPPSPAALPAGNPRPRPQAAP